MGQQEGEGQKVGFDSRLRLEFHGSKAVRHSRYITFQMADVAVSRKLFAEILLRIERLRCRLA